MARTPKSASLPVPPAVAKEVRKKVPRRELAAFVARAVEHELEHERLGDLLAELRETMGPPDEADLAEARALWRSI